MTDLVEMPDPPSALTPAPTLSRIVAPLPFHHHPAVRDQLALAAVTVFAMIAGVLGGRWLVALEGRAAELPAPIAAEPIAPPQPAMPAGWYELEVSVLDVGVLAASEPGPEQLLEPEPCQ